MIKLKNMYGKQVRGIERSTFLIGEDGRIEAEWRGVKVPGHAEAVLAAVRLAEPFLLLFLSGGSAASFRKDTLLPPLSPPALRVRTPSCGSRQPAGAAGSCRPLAPERLLPW